MQISSVASSLTHQNNLYLDILLNHPDMLAAEKGLITQKTALQKVCHEYQISAESFKEMLQGTKESFIEVQCCIQLIDKLRLLGKKVFCLANSSKDTFPIS